MSAGKCCVNMKMKISIAEWHREGRAEVKAVPVQPYVDP